MLRFAIAATAACLAGVLVSQGANALTLLNRDAVSQRVQIVHDGDATMTQEVILAGHDTLEDICFAGCTISLDNGEEESFEGYETVYIKDGEFVIAE